MNAPAPILSDLGAAALGYAERGWKVFPCQPGEKAPLRGLHDGFRAATDDPDRIRRWWTATPNANVGVACAASGLVVVDADLHKPECGFAAVEPDLPNTLRQRSANGGLHLVYGAEPGAAYAGKLCIGVDIKHFGYFLAEPSVVDGKRYVWDTDDEIVPAPPCLPEKGEKAAEDTVAPVPADMLQRVDLLRLMATKINSLDRDAWVRLAMALKHGCGERMREDFIEFSEAWPDCAPGEAARVWDSARPDGSVKVETAFHLLHGLPDRVQIGEPAAAGTGLKVTDAIDAIEFWQPTAAASMPRTEFLYSKLYARGYTSLTLAAPKVGKSMLALAEAVDMATGRGFLTGKQAAPLRAVYYCAEDRLSDIQLRVLALCQMYGIDQGELEGRLAVASGVEHSEFCLIDGTDPKINEAAFAGVEALCAKTAADVLIFDPLQDLSHAPETNEAFRMLGQRMRQLASDCDVALGIIHHTRKPQMGVTPTIDDGRGGSALRGTCRFNRLLVGMTQDEAAKADVDDHRRYMRIADAESNLAPPSSSVNRWFQKVSVHLDGDDGDGTGAIRPWQWPDAFAGITQDMAREVQARIRAKGDDDLPRANVRAKDWIGHLVGEVCEIDTSEKAGKQRAGDIVKAWLKSDVLSAIEVRDDRAGRDVSAITVGPNDMNSGGRGGSSMPDFHSSTVVPQLSPQTVEGAANHAQRSTTTVPFIGTAVCVVVVARFVRWWVKCAPTHTDIPQSRCRAARPATNAGPNADLFANGSHRTPNICSLAPHSAERPFNGGVQ